MTTPTAVICITPNPALDRTLTVPHLVRNAVHRADRVVEAAGGKGLNVARVLHEFGTSVLAIGPLAGPTGRLVAEHAAATGMPSEWIWLDEGETRTSTIIVDKITSTVINETGPSVAGRWDELATSLLDIVRAKCPQVVTVSGSYPPGVDSEDIARFLQALKDTGAIVWADTSGTALSTALDAGVGIKVNADEANTVVKGASAADLATALHRRTSAPAIVTDAARGAAFAIDDTVWVARAPEVEVRNATGAGDAFLAGFISARVGGSPWPDALALAVAAGSANATRVEPGIDPAAVEALRRDVRIEEQEIDHD